MSDAVAALMMECACPIGMLLLIHKDTIFECGIDNEMPYNVVF